MSVCLCPRGVSSSETQTEGYEPDSAEAVNSSFSCVDIVSLVSSCLGVSLLRCLTVRPAVIVGPALIGLTWCWLTCLLCAGSLLFLWTVYLV